MSKNSYHHNYATYFVAASKPELKRKIVALRVHMTQLFEQHATDSKMCGLAQPIGKARRLKNKLHWIDTPHDLATKDNDTNFLILGWNMHVRDIVDTLVIYSLDDIGRRIEHFDLLFRLVYDKKIKTLVTKDGIFSGKDLIINLLLEYARTRSSDE